MIELIIILIIGSFLIYSAYKAAEQTCPPPKIEYRFIPRTLKEEWDNPVSITDLYENMFKDTDPLTAGYGGSVAKSKATGILT